MLWIGLIVSGDKMSKTEIEIKCKCGELTYSDADRMTHDCDYYPHDIMVREELWGEIHD